jgi:hypothetical protein
MVPSRFFAPLFSAPLLAATFVATIATSASADVSPRVADIVAKGHLSPIVPVEAGLVLGLGAALLAYGLDRRARSRR